MAQILTVRPWLNITDYILDFSGQFSLRVYRIFEKFVDFLKFGGNCKNLPGDCLAAFNIGAATSNQVFDR